MPHDHEMVYLTDDPEVAAWFSVHAEGRGKPKVLEVAPLGPLARHDLEHQGELVGEYTTSWASVLRLHWTPDEVVEAMVSVLRRTEPLEARR